MRIRHSCERDRQHTGKWSAGRAATRGWRATAWLLVASLQLLPLGGRNAWAGPEGENVVQGQAQFERDGANTLITTTTRDTIVEYDRFDIGVDESVHIAQPDATSRILNRVLPGDPTRIDGSLSSNGYVYIVNASGVFFGGESIVDVAGLMAGAGAISNEDFLAGIDRFTDLTGDVKVAAGAQLAAAAVMLAGRTVSNHGNILAPDGWIALVAGDAVVLSEIDGRVSVRVEATREDPGDWAIRQAGTLDAGRGSVSLTTGDAYSLAMNHTGITRARDVQLESGAAGLVAVAGRIDATGLGSDETGGSLRVLGDRVALLDAALDASGTLGGGEILIGGALRGEDDTRTANRTYVSGDARLRADALAAGDGGQIVIWSEEKTGFFGSLSARGGDQGGDGGFAEISSRLSLESRGDIDLSAPAGRAGTLLYDPDQIEIVGGAPPDPQATPPDGDDVNADPALLASDAGIAGQILFDDIGDPAGVAPFRIYESEIEGTDADILLEAFRSVTATGVFDHQIDGEGVNVVQLMPDRRLSVTTGTPENPDDGEFLGIDLIPLDDNGDPQSLTWRASGQGAFSFATLIDPSLGLDAPIRIGRLENAGETLDPTFLIPVAAVTLSANRGDIEVEGIVSKGLDASADAAARAGGDMIVQTGSGDIEIGSIQARGGSAVDVADDGAPGADVSLITNDGGIRVGSIDVSGGDGREGELDAGGSQPVPVGRGGDAGSITLRAGVSGVAGSRVADIEVTGDLLARGGASTASTIQNDDGTLQTFSAQGGSVSITAPSESEARAIRLGSAESPIGVDTSGGNSASDGGDAGSIDIVNGNPDPDFGTGGGDIEIHGQLLARGGDSAESGAGGAGAPVLVTSVGAAVRVGDAGVSALAGIVSDGGNGLQGAEAVGDSFDGGMAGAVAVTAGGDVAVHGVSARGGTSAGGSDGSGASEVALLAAGDLTATELAASNLVLASGGDIDASLADGAVETLFLTSATPSGNVAVSGPDGLMLAITGSSSATPAQTLTRFDTSGSDVRVEYALRSDDPDAWIGIERGSVHLGAAGGAIAVNDAAGGLSGSIVGVGSGDAPHLMATGGTSIEAAQIGDLLADAPLVAVGAPGATLSLVAAGDVYVALSAQSAAPGTDPRFDVVDLTQRDVGADSVLHSIDTNGASAGIAVIIGNAAAVRNRVEVIDNRVSGQALAYHLETPAQVPDGGVDPVAAAIEIPSGAINLGADLLIAAPGDIQLPDGASPNIAVAAGGAGVALSAGGRIAGGPSDGSLGVAIDMNDVDGSGRGLALDGDAGVGAPDAPIRVRRIGKLAGSAEAGDFHLLNSESGDIRVAGVTDALGALHAGIGSVDGDVMLDNEATGGRIVLAQLAPGAVHITNGGDQHLGAVVEIDNARVEVEDAVFTPTNRARLVAGGEVVFSERIDTSPDAVVSLPGVSGADVAVLIPGSLEITSGGATQFGGAVGSLRQLGSLETDAVSLIADTSINLGLIPIPVLGTADSVDRGAFAGSATFHGGIDGAHALDVVATAPIDASSSVRFGGDVGTSARPTRLDVRADRIVFDGAERIQTGAGGIRLNVPADDSVTAGAASVATIYAPRSGLAFDSEGSFEIGRLEKLSSAGPLSIRAGQAIRVGDLNALTIALDAPQIVLKGRDASDVLTQNGTLISDHGGDLVANDLAFGSAPQWDGAGVRTSLVLGSGGISAPTSLGSYDVIRLNDALDAVTTASFSAADGSFLDLTGDGPPVVGDPTRELPRQAPRVAPGLPARVDATAPAPRAQVSSEQVLAFLDCARLAGIPNGPCTPDNAAVAAAEPAPRGTALGTERAALIAERYRRLVANRDVAARLRASALLAARDYRKGAGAGPIDGARFYGYLRQTPAHAALLAEIDDLARLFAEVAMLGMSDADTLEVERRIAEAFVRAANEPGFDTATVLDAVRASRIGLPT